jgi:hypothetical protein
MAKVQQKDCWAIDRYQLQGGILQRGQMSQNLVSEFPRNILSRGTEEKK